MNKITVSIEFSYKGEYIKPSAVLDLDDIMKKHHTIPPLHQYLATLHNIDSYSYEYEMLLAEDVHFSDAEGPVANFMTDGQLDQIAFEHDWFEQALFTQLDPIIKQQLNIDDINQQPDLKSVLLAAYQMGRNSK